MAASDDAPIPSFMGVARILASLAGLQRLDRHGPESVQWPGFCQGTVASMAGVDMIEAIHRFGRQNRIFFAHFRNPRGQVPVSRRCSRMRGFGHGGGGAGLSRRGLRWGDSESITHLLLRATHTVSAHSPTR